jgi:uncharacterized protein (TIGR03437 family)
MRILFLGCVCVISAAAQTGIITTFAGSANGGSSGDGGAATSATLSLPVFVATDPGGNTYIADQNNNKIRKVDVNGVITTFAGDGIAGFAGDGGAATGAELNAPTGVFVDYQGNVIINDPGNQRVRRVNTKGIITTIAGNGFTGYSGDNVPATTTTLWNAVRSVADPAGNVYIADQSNHRIRKIDTSGIITTFAGTGVQGFSGDGGPATAAEMNNPTSIAFDTAGNLYICDQFNQRVRKVDTNGIITTIAGTGSVGYSGDGGPATSANLNFPGGMIVDDTGVVYFSDDANYRVRKIASGIITTVAGDGTQGFAGDNGPAVDAELNGEFGLAIDPSGDLLIADSVNNRIREVSSVSSVVPVFDGGSVVNSASYAVGASAGELATVFGQHLSVNVNGVSAPSGFPVPTNFDNVTIMVNGVAAPIFAVVNAGGSEQINFQVPWQAAGLASAPMTISNGVSTSPSQTVTLMQAQPGVFNIGGGNGAIEHVNGTEVSTSNPAAPGEAVVVFATGGGPVSPALTTGQAAPGSPLSYTSLTPTVTIAGLNAKVLFSGAAPYFVGLNQINVVVPTNAPSGNQPLVVSAGGVTGNTVQIAIQ